MDLMIDVDKGFVKSLKYLEKEYIGATVPLFMIALRDQDGRQTRVSTFDMTLTTHTQTNEELVATYDNGSFGVMISVKMSSQISWRIEIIGVDSEPQSNKQNVTIRHCVILEDKTTSDFKLSNKNSEYKEVEDVKWIPLDEIDNYEWAFDHKTLIQIIAENHNII